MSRQQTAARSTVLPSLLILALITTATAMAQSITHRSHLHRPEQDSGLLDRRGQETDVSLCAHLARVADYLRPGMRCGARIRNTITRLNMPAFTPGLPNAPGALRILDGNPPNKTYITPELYWSTEEGRGKNAGTWPARDCSIIPCGRGAGSNRKILAAQVQQYLEYPGWI